MNLSEQDDLLNASFEEFTAAVGPSVRPDGADAVRVTVARRRRMLAMAVGALAALAIAIPLGTYAALGRSAHGPPVSPATAGPNVDPTNPRLSDLTVTAPTLAFGAPTGTIRTARITVMARNLGPSGVSVALAVELPTFVGMVTGPGGCAMAYYPSGAQQVECIIRSLAANSSRELDFIFRAPANADTLTSDFVPAIRVQIPSVYRAAVSPGGFDDPVPENNSQDLIITYD